ncbi:butyryl-CoA dehydrogenase [Actinopolyspora mzabensis]|uniref:short-chain 2-methylacyl-CoA dehydrogenase n=1 Tax=Actinopolyspora mzabensis TaxID=995066 RepID=A0A1G9EGM2_ACTMZ|nr:acyl-CoA dehydrogenase family protein [Actinopolyspora mzabensis]SDK75185.1 butyryl-CoA dehydrogenase [Actinopolyspora mzabensis]
MTVAPNSTNEPTVEKSSWRDQVRERAERVVRPLARAMDTDARLDQCVIDELFAGALMGIEAPQAYGGAGGDLYDALVTIEELARVDPAVAVFVDVQNALVINALRRHGTGDQQRRFLPSLATDTVGAYAISEDHAGSDAFALTTTAHPDGDEYVLSGRKQWITNAAEAGLFLVFARTGDNGPAPRLSAFLVERDTAGLSVGERIDKMGIRASSTCEVVLDNVRVSKHNMLGRLDEGNMLMLDTLDIGKLGIAAQLVGLAAGALDEALAHAGRRTQFGHPIIDFQGVAFPLAGLAAELEAARVMLYDTARHIDNVDPSAKARGAAMTKYLASHVAERITSQAVETLGGTGFTTASPVEKFHRDVKIGKIYEGTSNMQFRTILSTWPSAEAADPGPNGAVGTS